MTVRTVRVGDVLQLQRRALPIDPTGNYEEIGIRSFGKGIFHKEPTTGSDLGNKRVFRIEPGDLVISNVFAWEGAIAVASMDEAGKIGSHRFMTYTPRDEQINAMWAKWFFLSEPGRDLIRRASPGSAGRNRTLSVERFENLEIPLPPIDDQRQLASRIDRQHRCATDLDQRFAEVSTITSALAVSLTSRPDLSETEKLRAGWERLPLSDILEQLPPDTTIEPSTSYAIAGIFSFGRGLIDRGKLLGANTTYKTMRSISEGDVVTSRLNGWEGAVAVVPASFDGYCVSAEFPVFRPNLGRLMPDYFDGIARAPWFWNALNTNVRGSMVRRRRLSADHFLRTLVWLPPIAVQAQVASQLRQLRGIEQLRQLGSRRAEALVPATLNEVFASFT